MTEPPFSLPLEETVAIVGVGLIGGSLAAALRQRNVARRVIGVGRDASRLEAARRAGLIDEASTDLVATTARTNLIVFCTPVERVAEGVRTARSAFPSGSSLLITDAGSVKGPICEALADVPQFIGAHPIAGSHRHGFEAAEADLFEDRVCVLTPLPSVEEDRVRRLERFWQAVGMRTVRMTPDDHDRALAMTSHLPHAVASSLAATLSPEYAPLTGTGFRDSTRIAAGDPELWTGILMNNARHVVAGIDEVQHRLEAVRSALTIGNAAVLKRLLEQGQTGRGFLDR